MKGIMAEEFGAVINSLWNSKYSWTYANVLRVCADTFLLFGLIAPYSELCRKEAPGIRRQWSA